MTPLSRRSVVSGLIAGLGFAGNSASAEPLSYEDQLYLDDMEPAPADGEQVRGLNDWPLWKNQSPKPRASWAEDSNSVENSHLNEAFSSTVFNVDHATMMKSIAAFSCTINPELVLFGIRGANIVPRDGSSPHSVHSERLDLVEVRPDHYSRVKAGFKAGT